MISFFKKLLLVLLVATPAFSFSLYAADYNAYIGELADRLQTEITTGTNYENYSKEQRDYVAGVVPRFILNAQNTLKNWPDSTNVNDKILFGAKILSESATSEANFTGNDNIRRAVASVSDIIKGLSTIVGAPANSGMTNGEGGSIAEDAERTGKEMIAKGQNEKPAECSILTGKLAGCVDQVVGWFIRVIFVNIALASFTLAGFILNFAILFGLTSMKVLINQDIYTLWLFTRSLVIAAAIFCLLYFVALYLFGKEQGIQRMAAMMIVLALFSPFSFSISTWMIDVSDLATASLYSNIDKDWQSKKTDAIITTKYMSLLGYSGIKDFFTGPSKDSVLSSSTGSQIAINIMLGFTMLFNAYNILMLGIIFMLRDIGLVLCVIFSPLLIVDQAIPKLNDLAKKYRKLFFGLLAVGPVFMFLTYLGLRLTEVIQKGTGIPGSTSGTGLIFFNLITISVIIHYTYKYCKEFSGQIAGVALGALESVGKAAMIATPMGMTGKAFGALGQQTIGRGARALSRSGALDNLPGGYFGDKIRKATKYAGSDATFDFNNSKVIANAGGKYGYNANAGFVSKSDSFVTAKEKVEKKLEEDLRGYADIKDPVKREAAYARRLGRETSRFGNVMAYATDRRGDDRIDTEKVGRKARKLNENDAKKKLEDKVNTIDLENIHEKTVEEKAVIKEQLDKLMVEIGEYDPAVAKWFKDFINKKLLASMVESVKQNKAMDPLSPTFTSNNPSTPGDVEKFYKSLETGVYSSALAQESEEMKKLFKAAMETVILEAKGKKTDKIQNERKVNEAYENRDNPDFESSKEAKMADRFGKTLASVLVSSDLSKDLSKRKARSEARKASRREDGEAPQEETSSPVSEPERAAA